MTRSKWIFLDAGMFIGALLSGDLRHAEALPIVDAARQGDFAACTSVGVLSEVYAALTWVGAQPQHLPAIAAKAVRLLVQAPSKIIVLSTDQTARLKMLEMASKYQLTARRIHDARHAATALVVGVSQVESLSTRWHSGYGATFCYFVAQHDRLW